MGLPARCVSHVCEWCDYAFPTRSRWKKHVVLCARGTSRTGFRKQISDVLQWLGRGAYRCTFCGAEFYPEEDNVTRTGLPEARNHVANVHGMKHMRKAKMQWHGDPKHYNKEDLYKDKSMFWSQKVKDIERIKTQAQQESKLSSIQDEVNENIAEAAKSHKAMMEALEQSKGDGSSAVLMKLVPGMETELQTFQTEEIVEDGLVEHQVLLNIVNEHGIIEQRQVILDQSVVPQSQLYFGQEDIEGGGHEVVFQDSEILGGMEVTTATQTILVKSIPAGYKPDLEDKVEFASDVESIQIVESVNEEDYIEIGNE